MIRFTRHACAGFVAIALTLAFAGTSFAALPQLHNPVPPIAPAWATVLRPNRIVAVPRTVCPFGLSDFHVYNLSGRGYVQRRDRYGVFWARRGGLAVAGWLRPERAFISTTSRPVVIAVWCAWR